MADTNSKWFPLPQYNIIRLNDMNSETRQIQHIYSFRNAIAILDLRGTGRELALNLHTCQCLLLRHLDLIIQIDIHLIFHLAVQFNLIELVLYGVTGCAR